MLALPHWGLRFMNLLITAGNTQAPIDRVRVVTNIFTGRTGANIAMAAWARGHRVTVLTSHPELLADQHDPAADTDRRITVHPYQTFDDLAMLLQNEIRKTPYDAILHSAAVSDYLSAGVYAPDGGTFFNARTKQWESQGKFPKMTEHRNGKIKSNEPELWFRMVRAPKLIDRIRNPWGFTGLLVKFKLEVGLQEAELLAIAENSRQQSQADLMVANTLDDAKHSAYIGPTEGRYERVARRELAERIILILEHLQRSRGTPT
jgi:phosphopantothenate---cysteine ligase (CTP)